jgi:hypothetical protein
MRTRAHLRARTINFFSMRMTSFPLPKTNTGLPLLIRGSRLRYWLCSSLKRPSLGRTSKPLLLLVFVPFLRRNDSKSGVLPQVMGRAPSVRMPRPSATVVYRRLVSCMVRWIMLNIVRTSSASSALLN